MALLPREAARVHVDRHERLGLVDGDVAAFLEPDLSLHRLLDLALDAEVVEDRRFTAIELHPRLELRRIRREVLQYLLVLLLRVEGQLRDVLGEDVPNEAGRELHLLVQERGRLHPLLLGLLPELLQILDVALEFLLPLLRPDRPDDHPGVLRPYLLDQPLQAGALRAILDFPRDAHVVVAGHQHEVSTRERDLRGDTRSLRPDRLLGDLNQELLALL